MTLPTSITQDRQSEQETMTEEAKNYLMDCKALRRASQRHRRLGWFDSADALWREAKSRLGLARMWHSKGEQP